MGRALKTLFLLEDLCFGGTQRQSLELASRLDRARFAPEVLTLSGPGDLDSIPKSAGVPVHYMGKGRGAAPLFFATLGARLKRLAPDILVPCTALPNIWGRIWGRALRIPAIIGTVRGGGAPSRQHERLLWRLADGIVCNSTQLVEAMTALGAPGDRLNYIPNGIDAELFSPGDGQRGPGPVIVCVARLARDKDHQTLLRAFGRVFAKMPAARLRLVGDGPAEAALKAYALRELPPEACSAVEFAGSSAKPWLELRKADIFALASVREGQPNAILEAMACGLPVCATNAGGIPGLVDEGGTGLLSAPGDDAGLAANLLDLLADAPKREAFGRAARKKILEGFSFGAMVSRHEALFGHIARPGPDNQ